MSEGAQKIKEGDALYAKATDVIAVIWETFLEDDTAKKIRQSVWEENESINAAKTKMWKLPLQQKVINNAEIKSLQQEVQTLHEQEKSSEAEVEAFQLEAE